MIQLISLKLQNQQQMDYLSLTLKEIQIFLRKKEPQVPFLVRFFFNYIIVDSNYPRKSKLSIQLEEMKFKDEIIEDNNEDDYFTDSEEENNYKNERRISRIEENIIKKFKVNFYFDFNKDKKFLVPITTDSFNADDFHIYDLIKYIVKKINDSNIIIKDNNDNYSVSLKDTDEEDQDFYINNYELKPFDYWTNKYYEDYSPEETIKSIKEENINFFSKNPLNIFLMKQF